MGPQGNFPFAGSQDTQTLPSTRTDVYPISGSTDQEPEEKGDVFRGEFPSPVTSLTTTSTTTTSSSSSSSSWSGLGLRRGALRAILEKAISRWARASSGSSTSSSTSSSSSSVRNRVFRRRTRRPSTTTRTSNTTETENILRARRKAWQQGRGVPREFLLFLPTALAPKTENSPDHSSQDRRLFRSALLPLILSQLDSTIKRSFKLRKNRLAARALQGGTPLSKGKSREEPLVQGPNNGSGAEKSPRRPAWWLDVSSPTWNDMREIGKLLHIHPLTLEDILHQETREKLEVFPRLGYYFIVFRALESDRTRANAQTRLDLTMKGDMSAVPFVGMVGATNVYIVVFRDGICTFHYEDISEHTSRVRNRIIQLEKTFHMSSDWIAHGILDSIVDQVFPLLDSIEREIKELDHLVFSINGPLRNRGEFKERIATKMPISKLGGKGEKAMAIANAEVKYQRSQIETFSTDEVPTWLLRCAKPCSWGAGCIHRLISTAGISKAMKRLKLSRRMEGPSPSSPLVRMASTRRLVTSLTRLLGTKSEVVSQTQKRLTGNGLKDVIPSEHDLAGEVGMYLGDIQDHILSLQHSLAYYERMLSHLHPVYLSHLRVSLAQVKAKMDRRIFMLSLVVVSIMLMQIVNGVCSLNVNLPRNNRSATPPAPFHWFGGVIFFELLLAAGVVSLTRWWWIRAERKFARARGTKF